MSALNLDNPDDLAKAAKAKEIVEGVKSDIPTPTFPPDDHVDLLGFMDGDKFIHSATVQELNGEHEEALARALQTNNMFHFIDTLLGCGVAQLGDLGPSETKQKLKQLTIGDRDELVLAIRQATYGNELEIEDWVCPSCGHQMSITVHLDEADQVPRVKWDKPKDQTFEVDLTRGGKAFVRLNTGADQVAMFEDTSLTEAERNTVLLSRIVETITEPSGRTHVISAEPSYVRKMRITDRHAILKKLSEVRPGPRYNEVTFKHEECGNEVTLALGIHDLFRELFQFLAL